MLAPFRQQAAPLLPMDTPLLAAVSGGSDSVALLHLLHASGLLPDGRLWVAHFNHNLRPDADSDARFVQELASRLGVPFLEERWTAPPTTGNLPEQARHARYDFLLRAARQVGATHVATGHQRDDQAETVLERLLRGSGVGGLAGMRPRRPMGEGVLLVRPLLPFGRKELRAWLTEQALPWREDPGNRNPARRRSQIRHHLLPLLGQGLGKDAAPGLLATAARLEQADAALAWAAARAWEELAPRQEGACIHMDAPALLKLPDELQIRLLRRAHAQITGALHPPGSRAFSGLLRLLSQPRRRWEMRIQGTAVRRDGPVLTLEATRLPPRPREGNG